MAASSGWGGGGWGRGWWVGWLRNSRAWIPWPSPWPLNADPADHKADERLSHHTFYSEPHLNLRPIRNYLVAEAQWHEAPTGPVIKAMFSLMRRQQPSFRRDFCNGTKLCRADLLSGESHRKGVGTLPERLLAAALKPRKGIQWSVIRGTSIARKFPEAGANQPYPISQI